MSRRPKNPDTPAYTGKYYLTNATLLPEVIKCREAGKISDKLARMLMLLTDRYSRSSKFGGYTFREDMVSEALINLCQNALKFDPANSSNPFAFYTTAIYHSFLQFLNNEKKHRNIRDMMLIELGENPSFNYMANQKGGISDSDNVGAIEIDPVHAEVLNVGAEIIEAKERKVISDAREVEEKLAELAEKLQLNGEDDIIDNIEEDIIEEPVSKKKTKKEFFKYEG